MDITTLSTKELVERYNHLTGKSIKKFQDRATAERRVGELLKAEIVAKISMPENLAKIAQAINKSSSRAGLPGPNSSHAGKRIHLLTSANPRRTGTHGHTSFSIMRDGMTYEEYRLAGGRTNDLAWDIAHGHVEMVSK